MAKVAPCVAAPAVGAGARTCFVMHSPTPAAAQPAAAAPTLELVCPAGSLPALKAALDHGASCVYLGLRDATNARNFAGLNSRAHVWQAGVTYTVAPGLTTGLEYSYLDNKVGGVNNDANIVLWDTRFAF